MVPGYGTVYKLPKGFSQADVYRIALFLCHRGPDCKDDLVAALAFVLKKLGVSHFFDRDSLQAGTPSNVEAMRAACHQAALAVVVVSETFFESKWCQRELNTFAWRSSGSSNSSAARMHPAYWRVSRNAFRRQPHMAQLKGVVSSLESTAAEASRDFVKRVLLEVLALPWLQDQFPSVAKAYERIQHDQAGGWVQVHAWLQEYANELGDQRKRTSGLVPDAAPVAPQSTAHSSGTCWPVTVRSLGCLTWCCAAPILGRPPARDPSYVPRKRQEEALERALKPAITHDHRKVVVMGPGGSGKTSVTLNHVLTYKHRYASCVWLRGASASELMASYKQVALTLELPNVEDGQEHCAVHRWMVQHSPCLVVVDNVDHVLKEVAGLLPDVGHVVLTSRDRKPWSREFGVVEMAVFTEEEALALLGEQSDAARALAKRVDYLPVALGVARHEIEAERRDVPSFGVAE